VDGTEARVTEVNDANQQPQDGGDGVQQDPLSLGQTVSEPAGTGRSDLLKRSHNIDRSHRDMTVHRSRG